MSRTNIAQSIELSETLWNSLTFSYNFICRKCSKLFTDKVNLQRHKISHLHLHHHRSPTVSKLGGVITITQEESTDCSRALHDASINSRVQKSSIEKIQQGISNPNHKPAVQPYGEDFSLAKRKFTFPNFNHSIEQPKTSKNQKPLRIPRILNRNKLNSVSLSEPVYQCVNQYSNSMSLDKKMQHNPPNDKLETESETESNYNFQATSVITSEELKSLSTVFYLLPIQSLTDLENISKGNETKRPRLEVEQELGTQYCIRRESKNCEENETDSFKVVLLEDEEVDYVDVFNVQDNNTIVTLQEVFFSDSFIFVEDTERELSPVDVYASEINCNSPIHKFNLTLTSDSESNNDLLNEDLDLGLVETVIDSHLQEQVEMKGRKKTMLGEIRRINEANNLLKSVLEKTLLIRLSKCDNHPLMPKLNASEKKIASYEPTTKVSLEPKSKYKQMECSSEMKEKPLKIKSFYPSENKSKHTLGKVFEKQGNIPLDKLPKDSKRKRNSKEYPEITGGWDVVQQADFNEGNPLKLKIKRRRSLFSDQQNSNLNFPKAAEGVTKNTLDYTANSPPICYSLPCQIPLSTYAIDKDNQSENSNEMILDSKSETFSAQKGSLVPIQKIKNINPLSSDNPTPKSVKPKLEVSSKSLMLKNDTGNSCIVHEDSSQICSENKTDLEIIQTPKASTMSNENVKPIIDERVLNTFQIPKLSKPENFHSHIQNPLKAETEFPNLSNIVKDKIKIVENNPFHQPNIKTMMRIFDRANNKNSLNNIFVNLSSQIKPLDECCKTNGREFFGGFCEICGVKSDFESASTHYLSNDKLKPYSCVTCLNSYCPTDWRDHNRSCFETEKTLVLQNDSIAGDSLEGNGTLNKLLMSSFIEGRPIYKMKKKRCFICPQCFNSLSNTNDSKLGSK